MEALKQQYSHLIDSWQEKEVYENSEAKTLVVSIRFKNSTRLEAKEKFIEDLQYLRYSYHWMDNNNTLIIRWDNAPRHLDVSVYHQHIGAQNEIKPSEPMTLAKVLAFIASTIGLLLLFWLT